MRYVASSATGRVFSPSVCPEGHLGTALAASHRLRWLLAIALTEAIPLIVAGCGTGLLVSQLNNYTLSPISEERISEAAGVNSAAGSFGLSFGLAFAGAIMLATLSFTFTRMADNSEVLPPAAQEHVAHALENDAEVMTNTQLHAQLAGQP